MENSELGAHDDAELDGEDTDDSGDADSTGSPWTQPNPCQGMVTYPPSDEEFVKPQRPFESDPLTRERMLEKYGGDLPKQGFSIQMDESLEPSGDFPDNAIFANLGQDATIHFAYVQNPDSELEGPVWLNVSMLVDYQPAQVELVRWNADRSEKTHEETGAGFQFTADGDVTLFDVTVPAEVFTEERMYELASVIDASADHSGHHASSFDRFDLFYGGYDRPSHPCFESPLHAPWNETELALNTDAYIPSINANVSLFPAGLSDLSRLRTDTFEARPGERVTLNISYANIGPADKPIDQTVLVPLVNGAPVDQRWYVSIEGSQGPGQPLISARKQFHITLPQEPGLYRIMVGSWPDAFLLPVGLDGRRNSDVRAFMAFRGSNIVRYRVAP